MTTAHHAPRFTGMPGVAALSDNNLIELMCPDCGKWTGLRTEDIESSWNCTIECAYCHAALGGISGAVVTHIRGFA